MGTKTEPTKTHTLALFGVTLIFFFLFAGVVSFFSVFPQHFFFRLLLPIPFVVFENTHTHKGPPKRKKQNKSQIPWSEQLVFFPFLFCVCFWGSNQQIKKAEKFNLSAASNFRYLSANSLTVEGVFFFIQPFCLCVCVCGFLLFRMEVYIQYIYTGIYLLYTLVYRYIKLYYW